MKFLPRWWWLIVAGALTCGAAEKITFYPDWFAGPEFAGFFVAEAGGYYGAAGLDVQFVPFKFGAKSIEAIAASPGCALGTIEGYIFLQQRARGDDVRALAAVLQESPAGFMSLDSAGITSARDFAGKRIGVHKFADPLYRWFLRRVGVGSDAATMIFVGNDLRLLTRGDVAAMQGYAIEELLRLRQQVGTHARFLSFRELGFDAYSEIITTTAPQLERHRATIQAFLTATQRGWSDVFAHPDEALAALRGRIGPEFDETFQRAALEALRPFVCRGDEPPLAPMSAEKWRRMQAACVEMGLLRAAEPTEAFLVPDLISPAQR